jgi:hypothetical protein
MLKPPKKANTLEERFTLEMACRLFLSASFLAWGLTWIYSDLLPFSRTAGALLCIHVSFVLLCSGIRGSKSAAWRLVRWLAALALVLGYTAYVIRDDPFVLWPDQPRLIALVYLAALPILVGLRLCAIRPLKVTMLLAIILHGIVVGVMVRPQVFNVAHESVPVYHSSWAGGRYRGGTHYSGHRRSAMYLYYPDNPRQEFGTERSSGKIGLDSMAIVEDQKGRAHRESSLRDTELLRVQIDHADPVSPWMVRVYRILMDLKQDDQWLLRFRARSDAPRSMNVRLKDGSPGNENLGIQETVELRPEWKTFEFPVTLPKNCPTARIEFEVGQSAIPIEWSEITWQALRISRQYPRSRFVVRHEFNDEGYRTPNIPLAKPEGTFRIAILGDSMCFGQGTKEGTEFPRVLESLLRTQILPGRSLEVMNLGICGLDTHQERLVYEHAAAPYRPDLVVLVMFKNDDEPPIQVEENLPAFASLPVEFRTLVDKSSAREGYKRCVKNLFLLDKECRKNGSRLAVVLLNRGNDRESCELKELLVSALPMLSLPMLDTYPSFAEYKMSFEESAVHRIDGHLNARAHRAIAEVINHWIIEQKLIPMP